MPAWDNSAMDGYAVRMGDCSAAPCQLRITGCIPAGALADGIRVEPGCAVRIMTGAPLPEGTILLVGLSGRGDKDMGTVASTLGITL